MILDRSIFLQEGQWTLDGRNLCISNGHGHSSCRGLFGIDIFRSDTAPEIIDDIEWKINFHSRCLRQ